MSATSLSLTMIYLNRPGKGLVVKIIDLPSKQESRGQLWFFIASAVDLLEGCQSKERVTGAAKC